MSDLVDVRERLARIETKVDLLVPLDARLRAVETTQAQSATQQSMIASLAGLVAGAIASYIARHF